MAVLLCLGPDRRSLGRVTTVGSSGARTAATACVLTVGCYERTQYLRIAGVQVDLLVFPGEGEGEGVVGGAADEVVLEVDFDFLGHR